MHPKSRASSWAPRYPTAPRRLTALPARSWTCPACPPPSGVPGTVHHTPDIRASGQVNRRKRRMPPGGNSGRRKASPSLPPQRRKVTFLFLPRPPLFFFQAFLCLNVPGMSDSGHSTAKLKPRKLRSPEANRVPALASRARGTEYWDPLVPSRPSTPGLANDEDAQVRDPTCSQYRAGRAAVPGATGGRGAHGKWTERRKEPGA